MSVTSWKYLARRLRGPWHPSPRARTEIDERADYCRRTGHTVTGVKVPTKKRDHKVPKTPPGKRDLTDA